MNFIDKFRIKRNPNLIDSLSSDKLKNDIVQYAINCGYQFNPSTIEKLIQVKSYRDAFKNQDEFIEYMKQTILNNPNAELKRDFYNLYSNFGQDNEKYIDMMKEDEELSESFIKEWEDWKEAIPRIKIENLIQVVDGKEQLIDELLQNHLDVFKYEEGFSEFAKYIATVKSPQDLYNENIKDTAFDNAFINLANPQNFLELFENLDRDKFIEYKDKISHAISENYEEFIPYLDKLDELYQSKTEESFVTNEIKSKVINYLKENNVLYNENVPNFVLSDDSYILQCIRRITNNYTVNGRVRKL